MQVEPVDACPVCGDARREVLHDGLVDRLYGAPGTWRLQRCARCGAAYLDPRPTRDAITTAYDAYYTHEPAPWPASEEDAARRLRQALRNGYLNARYDYALRPATPVGRLVVPALPRQRAAADRHVRRLRRTREGARVLDVGCANGEFLLAMRAAGWLVQGVETDPRAVARAREHGLDVDEGELDEGTYPPRSFDAITISHVLEHLRDPVGTLRACREFLRDDGVLWIATPNLASHGHTRYGRAWRGLEPPRHLVLFTPASFRRALDGAGFRVDEFQRPAPARWVYEASEELAAKRPSRLGRRLAAAVADTRSGLRRERGEELVALARPTAS